MKLTTRFIIAMLLSCVGMLAVAQSNKYIKANNNFGNTFNRLDPEKTLHFPTGCGAPTLNESALRKAAIWYDSCNAVLYVYNPAAAAWDTAGSGAGGASIDTSSLSNRINLKLNIADTAGMLASYLRKLDTASLSNRINLKADKSLTLTINGVTYDLSANRSWTIPLTDTSSLNNRINLKVDSVSIRLGDYVDTATYWVNGVEYDWYYIPVKNQLLGPSWVTYTGSGRTYEVHVPAYRIGSTFYPGIDTTITIDALSNPDSSRTDVFVATTTPNVMVKKSAESAAPVAPQADQDEIYLTFVTLTPSNNTSGVDTIPIYRENVEWTGSASGVTVNFNGTTTPYQGSKVTDVGAINGGDYIEYTYSTTVNRLTQSGISQFIKLKATVPNNNNIAISFWNGTTQVSNSINLPINKSSTSWQGISLGISDFTWTNSLFNKVRITYNGSGAGISGFLLDNIFLQSGISVPSAPTNYLQDIRRVGNNIEKQINNTWTVSFSVSDKADASTQLFAGFGLLGGGTLAANRTFSVDSAGSIATKTYVQDRVNAVPTVVSYGKNVSRDSTILLLSNGQRFAAKDSIGAGGTSTFDSTYYKGKLFETGGMIAGDSLMLTGDTSYIYGNSTVSYFATKLGGLLGGTLINSGISGTTFQKVSNGDNSFVDRLSTVPLYASTRKLLILDYGINDCNLGLSRTNFPIALASAIDSLVAKGWPQKKIVIMTPPLIGQNVYGKNRDSLRVFADHIRTVTRQKGVTLVDVFAYLESNGGSNNISSDSIHPSGLGANLIAELIALTAAGGIKATGPVLANGQIYSKGITMSSGSTIQGSVRVPEELLIGPATSSDAILQVNSTTRGFLMPRMTAANRLAIGSPAQGLQVYDTDSNRVMIYYAGAWRSIAYRTDITGGGGGGVTTVGAFSGSSIANGASISGSTITFGPADATNPGMVTTGTQTIAGAKTFTGIMTFGTSTSSVNKFFITDFGAGARAGIGVDNIYDMQFFNQSGDTRGFSFNLGGGVQSNGTNQLMRINSSSVTTNVQLIPAGGIGALTNPITWSNSVATGNKLTFYDYGAGFASGISSVNNGMHFYVQPDGGSRPFLWSKAGASGAPSAANELMRLNEFSAQLGINTGGAPNASAQLHVGGTSRGTLISNMNRAQRVAISSPAQSLMVVDTDSRALWLNLAGSTTTWGAIYAAQDTVATDASFTLPVYSSFVILPTITAGRTLTLPAAASYENKTIIIKVANSAGFSWSVSPAIKDNTDADVTTLTNDKVYTIYSDGSFYHIINLY